MQALLGLAAILVPTSVPASRQSATLPDLIVAPTPEGLLDIASYFERANEIEVDGSPVYPASDVVGAFRFICQPGQLNCHDPILYPGQVGGSPHVH